MTDVLEDIRAELWRANVRRRHRLQRRRLVAIGCVTLTVFAAGGTLAAVSDFDPLAGQWLPDLAQPVPTTAQPASATRIAAEVQTHDGATWTGVVYLSTHDTVCSIAKRSDTPEPQPAVGCGSAFAIAEGFLQQGPATYAVAVDQTHQSVFVFGALQDGATIDSISLGADTQTPTIGSDKLTVPVHAESSGLSQQGQQEAAQLPAQLVLRPFALEFARPTLPGTVSVKLHDADGKAWVMTKDVAAG